MEAALIELFGPDPADIVIAYLYSDPYMAVREGVFMRGPICYHRAAMLAARHGQAHLLFDLFNYQTRTQMRTQMLGQEPRIYLEIALRHWKFGVVRMIVDNFSRLFQNSTEALEMFHNSANLLRCIDDRILNPPQSIVVNPLFCQAVLSIAFQDSACDDKILEKMLEYFHTLVPKRAFYYYKMQIDVAAIQNQQRFVESWLLLFPDFSVSAMRQAFRANNVDLGWSIWNNFCKTTYYDEQLVNEIIELNNWELTYAMLDKVAATHPEQITQHIVNACKSGLIYFHDQFDCAVQWLTDKNRNPWTLLHYVVIAENVKQSYPLLSQHILTHYGCW